MLFGTFVQSLEHAQSSVHDKFALTHLHLLVHPFLQPHFRRALQTLETSGRVVHSGCQLSSLYVHPKCDGEGRSIWLLRLPFHTPSLIKMLEQGSLFGQGENEELLRVHLSASTSLTNKTVDTYLCWRDAFQHTVLLGKKLPPGVVHRYPMS